MDPAAAAEINGPGENTRGCTCMLLDFDLQLMLEVGEVELGLVFPGVQAQAVIQAVVDFHGDPLRRN
ncbi:hypothetical protein AFL94_05350 [Arthrobacter sp. LS16]|nr:hypothetical protein AFL94_05350 [Arthrobacter sp. LS16]